MIFAYIDDGTMEVFDGVVEVRQRYAADTVETGVVRFFDEGGTPLGAVFPQRADRRILGIRVGEEPRDYELHPDRTSGAEPLAVVLDEVNVLMPNQWFPSVDAIRLALAR